MRARRSRQKRNNPRINRGLLEARGLESDPLTV
jgi:hypothetical protein